ncbi:hypothetical protein [Nostoc sp. FACHB-110]|uniref:hypothetical protein n=1 Tax=Nostoc sp. FACHB-110 TaxID=2692834 RepID=UPI0016898CE8|nr:hypothetical protein [Nostoc sp. FACHB-110]MBD2440397.1 hypothetical protein [Nostoc sp. FACHB-110]
MRLNFTKNSILIVLLTALLLTQFGCKSSKGYTRRNTLKKTNIVHKTQPRLSRSSYSRSRTRKQTRENTATWSTLVNAINTGLAIKTEARTYTGSQQKKEVFLKIYIPNNKSNNLTQYLSPTYKSKYAYVTCPNINKDVALIERNRINNDDITLLNSQEKRTLVSFMRKSAFPQCQEI